MTLRSASRADKPRLGTPFALLATGVLASNASDGFLYFAAPLLVLTLTTDPVAVATATAVMQAVPAVFGLFAGSLADTRDRRIIMMAAAAVRAVILAALLTLILTDTVTLGAVFVALALFAAAELTFDISSTASVPDVLADMRHLERAHGVIAAGQQVLQGFIVAPFATIFFAWSANLPFAIGAALVLASVVAIAGLRRTIATTAVADGSSGDVERLSLHDRLAGGAAEVRANRPLRDLLIFTITLVALAAFGQAAFAWYLVQFLGVPEAGVGVLFVALGVGALLGSVTVNRLADGVGRRVAMLGGAVLLALGFGVVGLAPVGEWGAWVAGAGFLLAGLGSGWWNVLAVSARQRLVPREKLGRVSGFATTVVAFVAPVASLAGGWVTRADARLPWFATAVGTVVVVTVMGRMLRAVDEVAWDATAGDAAAALPSTST